MVSLSRWALSAGIAASAVGLLAGCSSSASEPSGSTTPSSTSVSREAGVLGSQLCILNGTSQTIHWVGELGPYQNGDHHPDAEGPLAPGAKWCTNGYNSYSDRVYTKAVDVTAQILFTPDGSDRSHWGANNEDVGWPYVIFGTGLDSVPFPESSQFTPLTQWEVDVTLPKGSQPQHDYHIRRLDDSEFFKEWLVTVRR